MVQAQAGAISFSFPFFTFYNFKIIFNPHFILIISLISESTIRSMLISSFLFLLPPILGLLEIASAEKVTFLSLLTGGEILKVCLTGNIDLSTVVIFVMTVLVIISSEIFMRYVFDK